MGAMKLGANSAKIKRIVRKYCKQLCANKLDNLEEMYIILETYKFLN